MIYSSKQHAMKVAASRRPMDRCYAARVEAGWTVRHDYGCSNSDVLEWEHRQVGEPC